MANVNPEEGHPVGGIGIATLAIVPKVSGVTLGFDRLVMLAAGASKVEDVIWTPVTDGGP